MSATPRPLNQSHEIIIGKNGSFVKQVSNISAENNNKAIYIGKY